MTSDLQIEPRELKERLGRGERFLVVDVREPWEHQICRIEGARLIPLGSLASELALLEEAEDVVLYCHHGIRSLDAAAWLRAQGVEGARSLAGGIERWATEIDSSVPRY
jgi:adenylyltransferase/sulfurtransferase